MSTDPEKSQPLPDIQHPTDVPPAYDASRASRDLPPQLFSHSHSHDSDSSHPPAYPTSLPTSFSIGERSTPPLVSIPEVEAHLRLLGAFWRLREDVVSHPGWEAGMEEEKRWKAFVTRAAGRFERWYEKVVSRQGRAGPGLLAVELPPLDVAMVWHAYCLNPHIYLEDGLTRTKPLFELKRFPLIPLSSTLDPTTQRPILPSSSRLTTYETFTGEPFLPSLSISSSDRITVKCPNCQAGVEVPWVNESETGFTQREFGASCGECGMRFGTEAMGVRRFCEHVHALIHNPTVTFLSGTLLDPLTGLPDHERSLNMNKRIFNFFFKVCKNKEVHEIGQLVEWSMVKVERCCRTGMSMLDQEQSQPRFRRVLSHYRHPGIFSLDLVGATLRQGTFVRKMAELGWSAPTMFVSDQAMLLRSVGRYHAWLDLMSAGGGGAFYVPTLDIDLVWHTAMLLADRYRSDTFRLLRRIPDHEDKVEEGALSNGFDLTSKAWKARFGVPYNYCGCPPASENLNSKFFKLKGKVLQRDAVTIRTDLASPSASDASDADAEGSHPSEHNAILVLNQPTAQKARVEREMENRKRAEQVKRAAAKGKGGDGWDEVHARRHGREGHRDAFMIPRPREGARAEAYLPYIMDGAWLAGGRCAAGLAGGLCQAGGGKGFCGNACGTQTTIKPWEGSFMQSGSDLWTQLYDRS